MTSPEVVYRDDSFRRLLKDKTFRTRLARLVIDEFHCIYEWSTFRNAYSGLQDIVSRLPAHVRLLFASATVTDAMRAQIMSDFRLRDTNTQFIRLKNESPNTFYCVQPMPGAAGDFKVMSKLLGSEPGTLARNAPPPVKFAIFMPTKRACESAAMFLKSVLPSWHQDKIFSCHSGMSREYKCAMVEDLKSGKYWGGCMTECGAMVGAGSRVYQDAEMVPGHRYPGHPDRMVMGDRASKVQRSLPTLWARRARQVSPSRCCALCRAEVLEDYSLIEYWRVRESPSCELERNRICQSRTCQG